MNGLLCSDKYGCQNGEGPHLSAAKPQVWMQGQYATDTKKKTQI